LVQPGVPAHLNGRQPAWPAGQQQALLERLRAYEAAKWAARKKTAAPQERPGVSLNLQPRANLVKGDGELQDIAPPYPHGRKGPCRAGAASHADSAGRLSGRSPAKQRTDEAGTSPGCVDKASRSGVQPHACTMNPVEERSPSPSCEDRKEHRTKKAGVRTWTEGQAARRAGSAGRRLKQWLKRKEAEERGPCPSCVDRASRRSGHSSAKKEAVTSAPGPSCVDRTGRRWVESKACAAAPVAERFPGPSCEDRKEQRAKRVSARARTEGQATGHTDSVGSRQKHCQIRREAGERGPCPSCVGRASRRTNNNAGRADSASGPWRHA
jgi:hypothetical protein